MFCAHLQHVHSNLALLHLGPTLGIIRSPFQPPGPPRVAGDGQLPRRVYRKAPPGKPKSEWLVEPHGKGPTVFQRPGPRTVPWFCFADMITSSAKPAELQTCTPSNKLESRLRQWLDPQHPNHSNRSGMVQWRRSPPCWQWEWSSALGPLFSCFIHRGFVRLRNVGISPVPIRLSCWRHLLGCICLE